MPSNTYYHVSPRENNPMIAYGGLLPILARGRTKAVWVCSKSRVPWALAHVHQTHGVSVSDLTIWQLRLTRRRLVRRRRGIYTCDTLITPRQIVRVIPLAEVFPNDSEDA